MLKALNNWFNEFLEQGDPRVRDLPLMKNPFAGWVMIAGYVYFVKVVGPRWMQKKSPYDLRNLMVAYNFAMVIANFYVFSLLSWYGYLDGYTLCQPVDYSYSYKALKMVEAGYLFYVLKFIEFADTIFFVLRKKDKQITALHVIHHSIVPFSLWFGVKFASGGYNALFPFLNTFVHVLMYSYYGVSALGPKFHKFLFWKKYMTYIQLAQFVIIILCNTIVLVRGCKVSVAFIFCNFIHALLFFFLFFNFFRKTYQKGAEYNGSPQLEDTHAKLVGSGRPHLATKPTSSVRLRC